MKQGNQLKEQFKDRLVEWVKNRLEVKFDNLNNIQRSRQMISFFVTEILAVLIPGIVPDDVDEVDGAIVDGSGDGGADFLYRTDDGQVLIVQAKYRGKDGSETADSIGRFCDLLQRLYLASEGHQDSLHDDLIELATQIDWQEDYFRLYYITTAKINPGTAADDRTKQGLVQFPQAPGIEDRYELTFLDQTGLNATLRDALSSSDFSAKPIKIPMLKDSDGRPWCHFESDDREMYIGEVSGTVLATVLQEHRSSLFTMNIRDYIGDSKTNKDIIATATNQPENFEYFNNGVTAVAGKIAVDEKNSELICEKVSIINGAQTVRSLLKAMHRPGTKRSKPVSSVRVLFRLMSFNYPTEIGFVSEVTRFNNTQNSVKLSDFRSNDAVQKDLARRFDAMNLGGRLYEYKNKRSTKQRNKISITLEEFTKAVFAFDQGPDDFFGGTSKLFDSSSTGLYRKVFTNPDSALSESEFDLLAGTFFICDQVKVQWERRRKELRSVSETMHPALERKGLIFFAVGEFLRRNYSQNKWPLEADIRRLVKVNAWINNPSSPMTSAIPKLFQLASKVLELQYDAKKSNDLGFKHRNWFRDPKTLELVSKGVDLALQFGSIDRLTL
jgi:hypothetical protein